MSASGYSPRIECGLDASAVGFAAQCGTLDPADVEALRGKAEQMLDRDDPMLRAITSFATAYLTARGDAGSEAMIGRVLTEAILADGLDTPRSWSDPDG